MNEKFGGVERIEGERGEVTKYMRDDMRDFYDHELKNANYLLVANATGLIGCLSTLKDYAATPQLKGLGAFISLFSIGFLLAVMGTIGLSLGRHRMLTWITHGGDKPSLGGFSSIAPLGLSVLCLIGALFLLVLKFHNL
jgi:hypothetical protein